MVLGGGEGGLWAVPPAGVQEAELPLGVWGRSPTEAGLLEHYCILCTGKTVFINTKV